MFTTWANIETYNVYVSISNTLSAYMAVAEMATAEEVRKMFGGQYTTEYIDWQQVYTRIKSELTQ